MNNTRPRKNLLADDEEDVVDLKLAVNREFASRFEVCRSFTRVILLLMPFI